MTLTTTRAQGSTPRPGWFRRLVSDARGAASLAVIAVIALTALVSFFWTPYDPAAADAYARWLSPSWAHVLGTDGVGRDIFSRIMVGARVTVLVSVAATALAAAFGTFLAVVGAFGLRWVREPVIILIDVLIAFPTLLIAMMLAASLGGSLAVVIVAVGISNGVNIARVLRPELRQVAGADFVLAARASGVGRGGILLRHILPGVAPVSLCSSRSPQRSRCSQRQGSATSGLGRQQQPPPGGGCSPKRSPTLPSIRWPSSGLDSPLPSPCLPSTCLAMRFAKRRTRD